MTDTASSIHSQIEYERSTAQPNAANLKIYRNYARGRQRGTLTRGQQRILRGLTGNRFADNVCGMTLGEISNRLLLTRFEVAGDDDQASAAAAVESFLRELWVMNQLPALSHQVHYASLRDGDHAVGISWNTDRVRLSRETWWDGKQGMFVAYGPDGRPGYAVKDWIDAGRRRRTIYYPDRIERYIAEGEGWRAYKPDGEAWPTPWFDQFGEPLGIPVVHFAALAQPNDSSEERDDQPEYGLSLLDGGLTGLQDEINDIQRDISAAARFTAYQMYWATGSSSGNVTLAVEPGALLLDENPEAKFGTLAAGSLQELERTLTVKLQAASRLTSVPMHFISGQWPSGEALMRAERPLIDKVEGLARVFGPAWASVAHKATRIANTFAGQAFDEALLISAVFANAERRDPLTRADIAARESPFVSQRQTLRTLGYSPDEIERIIAERDDDQLRQSSIGDQLLTAFSRGQQ